MFIYADNAATTKVSEKAKLSMLSYFDDCYGNPSSVHSFGQAASHVLQKSRQSIASQFHASAREIYFTAGGSEADNQAILSAAAFGARNGKKHIISTKFEHHAVLHTLDKLKEQGFKITLLDVTEEGFVRIEDVEKAIQEDTGLVTIMYANNEVGTIQPISEIGKLCREKGILFHTDGVQAAGHVDIDVNQQNIDLLSISAHKFHGPKGIGALYCRKDIELQSLIEGGVQERGKRAGTENIPAIVGMAVALEECCSQQKDDLKHVADLRNRLARELLKIPDTKLNGNLEHCLAGHLNLSFQGIEAEALLVRLDQEGIAVSAGSACTAGSLEPSHVLLALGIDPDFAKGSLRLSLSKYNTLAEIEEMADKIPKIIKDLRGV